MTHIPVQIPYRGFTEQSQYSAIPEGMTPSCLNVLPSDVWNGRTRISMRNGTRLYSDGATPGAVQFMGTYRVYEDGSLVEKIILVRGGKVYYSDPRSTLPATPVLFGSGTGSGQTQYVPFLNTTGLVEGVQFNEFFYFVDGDHYVLVNLTNPSSATAVAVWGDDSPSHGPFHTDPNSVASGERATLICRWGARLVLAGYKRTPNIWYACEPDSPWPVSGGSGGSLTDGWTGTGYIGAIAGSSNQEYGTLGDPIVAIFPFAQSGLMFACTNSFSFLTNDPVFEESVAMVSLTKSIGISGRRAWCQSQEKGAFILANDGLYYINANDFNFNRANRVSAGRLDSFFLRLDFGIPAIGGTGSLAGGTLRSLITEDGSATGATASTVTTSGTLTTEPTTQPVQMAANVAAAIGGLETGEVFPVLCYDPDREGVWIFLSVSGVEKSSLHLFYDLKTDSFWPQRFYDPKIYAPTSATYIGTSRTNSGRLFLGGEDSVSVIERSFVLGIDGWTSEMSDSDQRAQFVRSSLTFGPIIGQLPYRVLLNEVRVDLADDSYVVPAGFTDLSQKPILSVSTGETAQGAVGIATDVIFVVNLNALVIDGGNASASGSTVYSGSNAADSPAQVENVDGRFVVRPFGEYTQDDPFAEGTARVYDGPGNWVVRWNGARWTIAKFNSVTSTWDEEYEQILPDPGSPNGSMVTLTQLPVSPDTKDNADISGASFSSAEITEIGDLDPGRNSARKCRIRSEAMYLTIASDGRPWSIERMSVIVSQVGKSRSVTTSQY